MDESGTKWFTKTLNPESTISMFMGEYNHTLDEKGRLIIPSKFREGLGHEFVITKGMDGCLFGFPMDEWENFEEKLKSLPMTNKEARQFVRFFLAGAADIEPDKSGRMLIPNNLREYAGITREVVLIGVGGRIEIWSRENYDNSVSYSDLDEMSEHMFALGLEI